MTSLKYKALAHCSAHWLDSEQTRLEDLLEQQHFLDVRINKFPHYLSLNSFHICMECSEYTVITFKRKTPKCLVGNSLCGDEDANLEYIRSFRTVQYFKSCAKI